jgi:hypothetical protein
MNNMLWMGMGVGVGYFCTKHSKGIEKTFNKMKNMTMKKSS